jgi:hypothetical protein
LQYLTVRFDLCEQTSRELTQPVAGMLVPHELEQPQGVHGTCQMILQIDA